VQSGGLLAQLTSVGLSELATDGEAGTTVAERSTAAIGVANESGQPPLTAQADSATADDSKDRGGDKDDTSGGTALDRTARLEAADMAEKAGDKDRAASNGSSGGSGSSRDAKDSGAGSHNDDTRSPTDANDRQKSTTAQDDSSGAVLDSTVDNAGGRSTGSSADLEAAIRPGTPDLHSGHKLARRYRLEECVTRVDDFSSWRAVDEKLRRAVGIYVLPADHTRARQVLASARSAALLGDARFVQVLDAVEENDLVYVIHEWLPDATDLTALLASGPLDPHDAYQMVSQVTQAMAAAHREGLSHLRLTPDCVLRTESGQYRIRGLAVEAALHGARSEDPQREDTEAIGAVLYAALTQRWPHPDNQHGLVGLPKDVGLVAPDKVRAGVHRGLSALAMRALVQDGPGSAEPFTTPDEFAEGVAAIPRIRPPEPVFPQPSPYRPPTDHRGQVPPNAPASARTSPRPPALPGGRTGKVLKWSVSALLIAALGLGSWQLANTLLNRDKGTGTDASAQQQTGDKGSGTHKTTLRTLAVDGAAEYYPDGNPQHTDQVKFTYDKKPGTYWRSKSFNEGPVLAPYKQGVGIVYDLGSEKNLSAAAIGLLYPGNHTTVELYSADSLSSSAPLSGMKKLTETTTRGTSVSLTVKSAAKARYVLVWLTAMPPSAADDYSGSGFKQAITDVTFKGQ
jgi:serine/threonine protein kinase